MQIIKEENGFPYKWKAGRVEKLIRSILESKIKSQLPDVSNAMLINTTWYHEIALEDQIKRSKPDLIVAHNFADPAVPRVFDAIQQSGVPYLIIGNCNHIRLDYWAMVCGMFFKHYEIEEVELNATAKKFMCLNRKPHPHRIAIVDNLKKLGLIDQGIVSLGKPGDAIVVDNKDSLTPDSGVNDEMPSLAAGEEFIDPRIGNDIYTLGNINNWKDALLNIVTETEFSNPNLDNFFISEKTWKPIIGYRPFVVYGQPKLSRYLKENGFDIFEDLVDYNYIDPQGYDPEQYAQYASMIRETLSNITVPFDTYNDIKQRLINNKVRYLEYVNEQWDKLINLELNEHIRK